MHSWGWARVLFATRLVLVASGGPESRVHLPGFLKGLKLGGGGHSYFCKIAMLGHFHDAILGKAGNGKHAYAFHCL
jgi:hypothetical protein